MLPLLACVPSVLCFVHAGLAIGIALLGLPWRVTGVMLAGTTDYYQQQARDLTQAFLTEHGAALQVTALPQLPLEWVERPRPRKFGRVLPGDIAECIQVCDIDVCQ